MFSKDIYTSNIKNSFFSNQDISFMQELEQDIIQIQTENNNLRKKSETLEKVINNLNKEINNNFLSNNKDNFNSNPEKNMLFKKLLLEETISVKNVIDSNSKNMNLIENNLTKINNEILTLLSNVEKGIYDQNENNINSLTSTLDIFSNDFSKLNLEITANKKIIDDFFRRNEKVINDTVNSNISFESNSNNVENMNTKNTSLDFVFNNNNNNNINNNNNFEASINNPTSNIIEELYYKMMDSKENNISTQPTFNNLNNVSTYTPDISTLNNNIDSNNIDINTTNNINNTFSNNSNIDNNNSTNNIDTSIINNTVSINNSNSSNTTTDNINKVNDTELSSNDDIQSTIGNNNIKLDLQKNIISSNDNSNNVVEKFDKTELENNNYNNNENNYEESIFDIYKNDYDDINIYTNNQTNNNNINNSNSNSNNNSSSNNTNNIYKNNTINNYNSDNNVLIISEHDKKVYLPYKTTEINAYLEQFPNKYINFDDVVVKEFIVPLNKYTKRPTLSRFRETYCLIRDREVKSISEALKIALQLMFRTDINPAIIAACKTEEQLENYIDCLEKENLSNFSDFKIEFKVNPLKI